MRVVLFACLPLFAACASHPVDTSRPPVAEGEEFQLAIGESVGVKGGIFIVEFSNVLEDSRCPMNARCVWEGNARIALKVLEYRRGQTPNTLDVVEKTLELNTSERFPTRGNYGEESKGISIELRRLEPMPVAGVPTKDFVATLTVEAGK
jgi:hypothetical protein